MNKRSIEIRKTFGTVWCLVCLCYASVLAQQADRSGAVEYSTFTVLVTDTDGKPIPDALIYKHFSGGRGKIRELARSNELGIAEIKKEKVFLRDYDERRGVMLYVVKENALAGFITLQTEDTERALELRLEPVCRVHGLLKSSGLERLKQPFTFSSVTLHRDAYRPLSFRPESGRYEFLLPPGWYRLHAHGTSTYASEREFEIEPGQEELTFDIDLTADALATLMGNPAPELRDIKGWINSEPLTLKDLRGKVVLLDFWGVWCGPCLTNMPELVDIHEEYSEKGLVIIAVHDDSLVSTEVLKEKLNEISQDRWAGMGLPFAIALDGGGETEIAGTDRTVKGATAAAYGVPGWPTYVLIDRKGKVVSQIRPGNTGFLDDLEAALGLTVKDSTVVSTKKSRNLLMGLGLGAHHYVRGHRGKLPDSVARARMYIQKKEWEWIDENIEYLGKGKTTSVNLAEVRSGEILAYDKSLLERKNSYGTNVLFTNLLVQFKDLGWLKEHGIEIENKDETSSQRE